jgi:hypothetical protein
MRHPGRKRNFIGIVVMTLLLAVAMPATSFGSEQVRRHGRGRNFDNRKCGKFVNCHDARDGRWDKRGRRNTFSWYQRNRTLRNRSINNNWQSRWRNIGSLNGRHDNRWRNVRARDNRWRN